MTARDAKITELICLIREAAEKSQAFWNVCLTPSQNCEVERKGIRCAKHYEDALASLQTEPVELSSCLLFLGAAGALEKSQGFNCARPPVHKCGQLCFDEYGVSLGLKWLGGVSVN